MPLKEFENQFQKQILAILNAIRNQKTAHAYLLHCDNRELSENFAKALAQALACKNKSPDGDACGKCDICLKISKGTYPELFILMPTSKSRRITIGEDENDQDSIRWFQSLFYYRAAFSAGKKIGIIFDADTMMPQAQNAFLKTLEEPPADSNFIICTSNPSELLPTFRSRCQRLTILRNSQDYQEDYIAQIIPILDDLCDASQSIEKVEKAATELAGIFEAIKEKAKTVVNERFKYANINYATDDKKYAKRFDERFEAAQSAEYILLREEKLCLIYTYFFQLYQLAVGIAPELLPNSEILRFSQIKMDFSSDCKLHAEKYLKFFRNAEDFISSMKLNVSEQLAVRAFCYSFLA